MYAGGKGERGHSDNQHTFPYICNLFMNKQFHDSHKHSLQAELSTLQSWNATQCKILWSLQYWHWPRRGLLSVANVQVSQCLLLLLLHQLSSFACKQLWHRVGDVTWQRWVLPSPFRPLQHHWHCSQQPTLCRYCWHPHHARGKQPIKYKAMQSNAL